MSSGLAPGASFINLRIVHSKYPHYVAKKTCTVLVKKSRIRQRLQLRQQLHRGTLAASSILVLQFTAQDLASRKSWYLTTFPVTSTESHGP